ncbi:chemotaxis protein CheW [Candidatus Desulfatibia sp.]|uniref:chemotaxis protein CheW n=1 Tax=Candidatus Desulfatibia sp. TaxID=3101189 RepID=UPI0039B9CC0A
MAEVTETMDQGACPVEYTPAGDSTGVKAMADKEGKYLTFSLASEEYGISILKIKEIIGMMPITTVPQTPEFVKGVINLRGKVIPVIDLRLRFGLRLVEPTPRRGWMPSITPSAPALSWLKSNVMPVSFRSGS